MHAYMNAHAHTRTPAYTCTHVHTPGYTSIHMHTPAYTCTHTHTHAHTYMHIQISTFSNSVIGEHSVNV